MGVSAFARTESRGRGEESSSANGTVLTAVICFLLVATDTFSMVQKAPSRIANEKAKNAY